MNGEIESLALWAFNIVTVLGLASFLGYLAIKLMGVGRTSYRHADIIWCEIEDEREKSSTPHQQSTLNNDVPKQYRNHASFWRQGFSDGATLISLSEPVVRKEIADYSRDEFNAYYDGVSTRITEEQERAVRREARAQELQRLKDLDAEYRHALNNEI